MGAALALGVACSPTEPCACPPSRTHALFFGAVHNPAGGAVPGATVRLIASAPGTAAESCDFRAAAEPLEATPPAIRTDARGEFRADAYSGSGPAVRCVRVTAYAGTPGASDSARVDGLLVNFRRDRERPDSVGLVVVLPLQVAFGARPGSSAGQLAGL